MRIWKEVTFDAAHYLPGLPRSHKCSQLHGHTYSLRVEVSGVLMPTLEWVMDLGALKETIRELVAPLDHHCLNDVEGLENPTAERLAIWMAARLNVTLPIGVTLESVAVSETPTSGAEWRPL